LRRVGLCLTNAGGRWRKVQAAYIPEDALGEWVTPTARPALSKVERALVDYALDELDGCFIIGRLYEAVGGISKRALTALAQDWQRRGWLTEPEHATDPRRVTSELVTLAGYALGVGDGDTVTGVIGGDRGEIAVTGNARTVTGDLPPFLRGRAAVGTLPGIA
jgi:hypothetical protein